MKLRCMILCTLLAVIAACQNPPANCWPALEASYYELHTLMLNSQLGTQRADQLRQQIRDTLLRTCDGANYYQKLNAGNMSAVSEFTLLDLAAVSNDPTLVQFYLSAGVPAAGSQSPPVPHLWTNANTIHLASAFGADESVKALLSAGIDANVKDDTGTTALFSSVGSVPGGRRAITELLQHGANPNIVNAAGETALYRAVIDSDFGKACLLLENGANPEFLVKGKSIIEYAQASDAKEIKDLFGEYSIQDERRPISSVNN